MGDLDHDGQLDLVVADIDTGAVKVLRGAASGTFTALGSVSSVL